MLKTRAAALLLTVVLSGCAQDEPSDDPAPDSAAASETPSESEPTPAEPAPRLAAQPLPPELIGSFDGGDGGYFTFYAPGDQFCADRVGTQQGCYAVRGSDDESEEPIETGVAGVKGPTLLWSPTQDPMTDCIGRTNKADWEETAAGVRITPTDDCHGTTPLVLKRVS